MLLKRQHISYIHHRHHHHLMHRMFKVSASGFVTSCVQLVAPPASRFSNVLLVQLRAFLQKRLLQLIDICEFGRVSLVACSRQQPTGLYLGISGCCSSGPMKLTVCILVFYLMSVWHCTFIHCMCVHHCAINCIHGLACLGVYIFKISNRLLTLRPLYY